MTDPRIAKYRAWLLTKSNDAHERGKGWPYGNQIKIGLGGVEMGFNEALAHLDEIFPPDHEQSRCSVCGSECDVSATECQYCNANDRYKGGQ